VDTQAEAADTQLALVGARIGPAQAADKLPALAEAHTVPVLAPAGQLAGSGPPQQQERSARHPRLARLLRNFCKICHLAATLCHKKGKTWRFSNPENGSSGSLCKVSLPQPQSKAIPISKEEFARAIICSVQGR
jgi:hypothetical protein